jgi:GNAT superfamily N-acetyltransferase
VGAETSSTAIVDGTPIVVDCAPERLDVPMIHAFLSATYWARAMPIELLRRAIEHSLCFGLYAGNRQIGFARVISDYTTFAYLADVFVIEGYRGRGLSKQLMNVMAHPRLQDLRRWLLVTRDAHALYAQYGFKELAAADRMLERHDPDVYVHAMKR